MLRLAFLFSGVFVAYDVLAAGVTKGYTIAYDSLLIPELVIVFFMGVFAGRVQKSWSGLIPVAVAAAVETTAGWYAASLIGSAYVPGWTVRILAVMATERFLSFAAIGAAGVWIGLGVAGSRHGLS